MIIEIGNNLATTLEEFSIGIPMAVLFWALSFAWRK